MQRTNPIALRGSAHNTLNVNVPLLVTSLSGPNFNIPTQITPPRIAEVGLTYTF